MPDLSRQVMLVRAGEAQVGIVVGEVAAVAEQARLSAVPKAPPGVLGIMNHLGSVLTVVSLAAILGLPEPSAPIAAPFVVVVERGEDRIGLRVERVDGITLTVDLDQDIVTDGPDGPAGPLTRGWLAVEGSSVRLVDGAAIVGEVLARFERRERRA
ncbi:MAG TPA: chemotaxis protein CheW [Thermodesulfobacteriota bacterium]